METCRMYRNEYPEEKQLVYVRVTEVNDINAYVELLEYNNIRGMILLSELTRKNRIRSITKYIKVGRNDVMIVLRVSNGDVNLSKRRIEEEEIKECEEKYSKNRTVQSILRNVGEPLLEMYETFAWDLADKYGHIYDAFTLISRGDEDAINMIPEKYRKDLCEAIERRITQQEVKVEVQFELTCYEFDGITAIQEALLQGEKYNAEITASLVSAPLYTLSTMTYNEDTAHKALLSACDVIKTYIESRGGNFKLK